MERLRALHKKHFLKLLEPMTISGAIVGAYTGMYIANEEKDKNMLKTWAGGVIGSVAGMTAGAVMAYTYPIAIAAAGVRMYDYLKQPIISLK